MAEKTGAQTIGIIILTAICTALAMYVIPRVGDKVAPPDRQVIDIGSVNDTLHFVTTTKEVKPKIVYAGGTFTLNGKTISTQKLVETFNDEMNNLQDLKDSLYYYRNATDIYKNEYSKAQDSAYIYSNINKFIKQEYGFYYTIRKGKDKYIYTRRNSEKIDSAMVLLELYGDRLRLNDGRWSVLNDKEYRRERRQNN